MTCSRFVPLALVVVGLAGAALARPGDDTKDGAKDKLPSATKDAPKPPTVKAEKAPFKVEVTLKGVFESPQMTEVLVKPEAWVGGFPVLKAVEPGTVVKKGDALVTFDTEKIDKAIRDLETDQALADLAIRLSELDLPILERMTPLDLAAAERQNERAQEDLKKFLEIDKPLAVESAEFDARNSKHRLEYSMEELKQLEKMYRSKDLTEETEEIILKRQRHEVEMMKFMLKMSENRRDQSLKVTLPRREQDIKDMAEKSAISWEKSRASLPLALNQKRLSLEKAKYERARAQERLTNLKKDRELFAVQAPADGVVYYGKCVQGNWPSASSLVTRLQKGGSVSSEEVFMTIVQPKPLFVRAAVDEKDAALIPEGATAKLIPAAHPDSKLSAKVERMAVVPIGGSFEVKLAVDGAAGVQVVPGMTCSVKVTAYAKPDAVVVPAVAVFNEELDEDKHFVYRPSANGKPEKQAVVVGKRSGGKAEVVSGLSAGDEILLSKP